MSKPPSVYSQFPAKTINHRSTHDCEAWIPSPSPRPCCTPWYLWACSANLWACYQLQWYAVASAHHTLWPCYMESGESGRESKREREMTICKQNSCLHQSMQKKQPVNQCHVSQIHLFQLEVRRRDLLGDANTKETRRWHSAQQSRYLETALKEVFARDDVCDLCLVQAVCDGHGSECGVQGHNCNQTQPSGQHCKYLINTSNNVWTHVDSRGKLYMKQAWAAMTHSALVSQTMAMLRWGIWPRAARPLPKQFAAW